MIRIISSITFITCIATLVSCSEKQRKSDDIDSIAQQSTTQIVPDITQTVSEVFGINGEDIFIRTGPGLKYGKLVNEKATRAIGETTYCEIDFSIKVMVLEKKDKWSKIKVVEPTWLSDSYIGWIPSKVIITEDKQKKSLVKLNNKDYEILKTNHNSAVQNFYVLLKRKKFDKDYAHKFINAFRSENCTINCNVELYDSKSIMNLIGIYPLEGNNYLKVADHLISSSTFDSPEVRDWYPYQDFHYEELGGRNWKKRPIK